MAQYRIVGSQIFSKKHLCNSYHINDVVLVGDERLSALKAYHWIKTFQDFSSKLFGSVRRRREKRMLWVGKGVYC